MIPLQDNIPSRTVPFVTYSLLGLNVLAFAAQLLAPAQGQVVVLDGVQLTTGFDQVVWQFGLRPYEIVHLGTQLPPVTPIPEVATALTSMFLHGGFMHLGGNMLYLWIFADNVEDAMGHVRFLLFYLLAGFAAAGLQIATDPESVIPMVGASGAIAGVLGGYMLLYPRARVKTLLILFYFIRIVELPAMVLLGFWFVLQLLGAPGGGGTAWFAHIGGFVFGLAAVKLFTWGRRVPHRPRVRTN